MTAAHITELEMTSVEVQSMLARQTLEFNADNSAFQQVLRWELGLGPAQKTPYTLAEKNDYWGSMERAIQAVAFAVYCVFRFMGDRDLSHPDGLRGVHPAPQIRMQLAIKAGVAWMNARCDGWSDERILREINVGIAAAEYAFNRDGIAFRNPYQKAGWP